MFIRAITTGIRQASPALAGAALLAAAGLLHAQGAEPVVYKECFRPPERTVWGSFPECGVDEEATRQLQKELDEATSPLTPQEEEQVNERIEEEFAAPVIAARQTELLALLDWTARRIEAVLSGGAYQFAASDEVSLRQAKTTIQQRIADTQNRALTRRELDDLTAEVRGIVTDVSRIVAAVPKVVPEDTPDIESLVTRIDALVARVGTVIRDLEREGLAVPSAVRGGYAHALQLVRESKRTCSTRRPEACANLAEVLDTIDAMREPLCRLKSDFLTTICE